MCTNTAPKCAIQSQNCHILYPRLRGGELFDYISKKDFLTEEEAIDFTRQILQGLQHLHSRSVVHLDLKVNGLMLHSINTTR
jgi:serine/threonine protein kinase